MRRVPFVIVALSGLLACRRAPPPGSGAIETTGTQIAAKTPDDPTGSRRVLSYPGGGVLVVDGNVCSLSMIDATAGILWTRPLPECAGILEAVIANDSVAFARTGTGMVAISLQGQEKWRLAIGTDPVPRSIFAPAVTPDSRVVVASSLRQVIAFTSDGSEAWRFSVAENEKLVAPPSGSRTEGVLILTDLAVYNVASDGTLRYRRSRNPTSPG